MAAKLLFRKGGYKAVDTATLLSAPNVYSLLEGTAGAYGLGVGIDAGALAALPLSKTSTIQFGASWLDCANTSFSGAGVSADPIQNNLSFGAAYKFEGKDFSFMVGYDYRNMLQDVDWLLKHHFGIEVGFPAFRVNAGVSQNYLSAGISLDIWIAKIWAVTYASELSSSVGADGSRRYILGFDAKF
jgi:hypothetical protein